MAENKTLATFRLDAELWEQFKAIASKNGTNASAVLISLCRTYIEGASIQTSSNCLDTESRTDIDNLDERIDRAVQDAVANARTELVSQTNHLLFSPQGKIERLEANLTANLERLDAENEVLKERLEAIASHCSYFRTYPSEESESSATEVGAIAQSARYANTPTSDVTTEVEHGASDDETVRADTASDTTMQTVTTGDEYGTDVLANSQLLGQNEVDFNQSLTATRLAERLRVHGSQPGRHRKSGDLEEWSQKLDPDGISWRYEPVTKLYYPKKDET